MSLLLREPFGVSKAFGFVENSFVVSRAVWVPLASACTTEALSKPTQPCALHTRHSDPASFTQAWGLARLRHVAGPPLSPFPTHPLLFPWLVQPLHGGDLCEAWIDAGRFICVLPVLGGQALCPPCTCTKATIPSLADLPSVSVWPCRFLLGTISSPQGEH